MPNSPRITVITPSLNHARYLERAICSVLDQGYENLQFIVIDGGSSDESVPLIRHYEDDIAYWRTYPDAGPADAINEAITRADGDYVCILPADALMLPGTLHTASQRLSDSEWAVAHCHSIDADDELVNRWPALGPSDLATYLLRQGSHLPLESSIFRRGVLDRHGGFDREMRYGYGYEMSCRLLAAGVMPRILGIDATALRESARSRSVELLIHEGRELVAAVERYANMLSPEHRQKLWTNCEERRRIYAMAESESVASQNREFLWRHLLKRPWWLASDEYRHALLRGVAEIADAPPPRLAA